MSVVELHQKGAVEIDRAAVLRSLNLNPNDPKTQALLLVCDRYHLDPLLKHMVLISGNPYVTRDGYLALAHASGQFDGLEVLETGETDSHYTAKVAVYRKDMGRPFSYTGRYVKTGQMGKQYGPEMAIKCAEVAALRRAFNVTGVGAADERWDAEAEATLVEAVEVELASEEQTQQVIDGMKALDTDVRDQVKAWWQEQGFPPVTSGMLSADEATAILNHLAEPPLFVEGSMSDGDAPDAAIPTLTPDEVTPPAEDPYGDEEPF